MIGFGVMLGRTPRYPGVWPQGNSRPTCLCSSSRYGSITYRDIWLERKAVEWRRAAIVLCRAEQLKARHGYRSG